MGMRYPILVTDIDGTLLSSDGVMSSAASRAARGFLDAGGDLILATGKLYQAAEQIVRSLGLSCPQIVCDGAAVVHPEVGDVVARAAIRPSDVTTTCSRLRMFSVEHVLYTPAEIRAERGSVNQANQSELRQIGEPDIVWTVPDVGEWLREPVLKVLCFTDDRQSDKALIDHVWAGSPELRAVRTTEHFVEFSSPRSGKLAALDDVLGCRGIDLSRVACIGDNDNDADMVSAVGLGAAVSNGSESVLAVADVIVPSNDRDGFAWFVEKLLGMQE